MRSSATAVRQYLSARPLLAGLWVAALLSLPISGQEIRRPTAETGDSIWKIGDLGEHIAGEANISSEQLEKAVEELRNLFRQTYGDELADQATEDNEEEKQKEEER